MLPLPAASPIRRLYVLDFGLFKVNEDGRVVGIPGFLMQTEAGQNILFDTGFPPHYATDAHVAGRLDGLDSFGHVVRLGAENLLAGQLALLDLTPADIDLTILSHGHVDHVGGLAEVAHAPILMTAREKAEPRPLYHGDHRPLEWPEAAYHLIDDDTEICPGLILIPTPGHTHGHLSALLILPDTGPTILTADALSRPTEAMEGFAGAADEAAARASASRLFDLARDAGAFVIWGHSPAQWPMLRRAPEFYG